jgi:hypothetical protein
VVWLLNITASAVRFLNAILARPILRKFSGIDSRFGAALSVLEAPEAAVSSRDLVVKPNCPPVSGNVPRPLAGWLTWIAVRKVGFRGRPPFAVIRAGEDPWQRLTD